MNRVRLASLPTVFALFLAFTGGQGCETLENAKEAQEDLCCSDFVVGANLSAVNWKVEGATKAQYSAFMQATGDLSAVATVIVEDIARACKNIATDLGEPPTSVTETKPSTRATKWCALAATRLQGAGAASVKIGFTPPACTVEASAQASCEGSCSVSASCQVTPAQIALRCDPAKLSGKCSGSCSGTCEGSASVAVSCQGSCDGTCEGKCDGGTEGNAACAGTCEGKCRGTCKAGASAAVKCEAECTGSCSVEYAAPKCKGELSPPSAECNADADCNASCKASASAKAECKPAKLDISASASAELAATIEANLPVFIELVEVRGKVLIDNAALLGTIGGRITAKGSGDLGVKGVACLVPATTAVALAVENLNASFQASGQISGSFGKLAPAIDGGSGGGHTSPMLTFPLRVAGKTVSGAPLVKVRAPWTNEVVGEVGLAGPADAEAAAAHAAAIFPASKRTPAFERRRWLRELATAVSREAEMLAGLIAEESGKPITLARAEVARGVATLELGAEEATRCHGELLRLDHNEASRSAQGLMERVPLGPVFALSPFNFPLNLVCHKVAPALALGIPLVLKPAPQAPLTALALAQLAEECDFPAGLFQVLPCEIPVAEALAKDPRFPVVSFTGSARVGFHLRALVPHKRVVLELGGNAAAIVLADADLEHAASRVVAGAFAYSGQVCIKTQRVYVEASVYEAFVADLVRRAREIAPKQPHDEKALLSCLIDLDNAQRVDKWIDEARTAGARALVSGPREGKIIPPSVLAIDGAGEGLKVVDEEVFGPVLTVHRAANRREAFEAANRGKYGLQAALFTRDVAAIDEAYEALEVGALIVNDATTFRVDAMPYGGTRESGSGREGVRYAMDDLTERKLLVRRR